MIEVNIDERRISVDLSDEELEKRSAAWKPRDPNYKSGVMAKYAHTAKQADDGAVSNLF